MVPDFILRISSPLLSKINSLVDGEWFNEEQQNNTKKVFFIFSFFAIIGCLCFFSTLHFVVLNSFLHFQFLSTCFLIFVFLFFLAPKNKKKKKAIVFFVSVFVLLFVHYNSNTMRNFHYERGQDFLVRMKLDETISEYQKMLNYDPNFVWGLRFLFF